MNARSIRIAVAMAAMAASCAAQSFKQVELQPADARQAAPDFALRDSAGKTATLGEYRGKVVLLDFWATWCTGCKQEIPWFTEFQKEFGKRKFAVVGVSLDEGGWKVLGPFLAKAHIPYRMLLGDNDMAHRFAIEGLPDTFLIDQSGRIAAVYRESLVNRDNVEANIRTLLARR